MWKDNQDNYPALFVETNSGMDLVDSHPWPKSLAFSNRSLSVFASAPCCKQLVDSHGHGRLNVNICQLRTFQCRHYKSSSARFGASQQAPPCNAARTFCLAYCGLGRDLALQPSSQPVTTNVNAKWSAYKCGKRYKIVKKWNTMPH